MTYEISSVRTEEHSEITNVWEASVRATHDFLSENDIEYLKPLIGTYLDAVTLVCIRSRNGQIIGFVGAAEGCIEMLFVDPAYRAKAVGKTLLLQATTEMAADKVDVNEQNKQAVGFYVHMGFEIVGRSPLDDQGRPFPLLHMRL